ncbi:unnamed protein product [Tenebrio molitor]|nr:unnamed protein product [Tenebrio molitor]
MTLQIKSKNVFFAVLCKGRFENRGMNGGPRVGCECRCAKLMAFPCKSWASAPNGYVVLAVAFQLRLLQRVRAPSKVSRPPPPLEIKRKMIHYGKFRNVTFRRNESHLSPRRRRVIHPL